MILTVMTLIIIIIPNLHDHDHHPDHQVVRLLAGMKADEEIWNPHVARLFFVVVLFVYCVCLFICLFMPNPHIANYQPICCLGAVFLKKLPMF